MKMKENFLDFSEKLNASSGREIKKLEDFIYFLGIFQNFFSNKKLIKKNSEVANVLEKNFEIEFAEYAKKSRPLMLGKSIKYFYEKNKEIDVDKLLNKMYRILYLKSEGKTEDDSWDNFLENL